MVITMTREYEYVHYLILISNLRSDYEDKTLFKEMDDIEVYIDIQHDPVAITIEIGGERNIYVILPAINIVMDRYNLEFFLLPILIGPLDKQYYTKLLRLTRRSPILYSRYETRKPYAFYLTKIKYLKPFRLDIHPLINKIIYGCIKEMLVGEYSRAIIRYMDNEAEVKYRFKVTNNTMIIDLVFPHKKKLRYPLLQLANNIKRDECSKLYYRLFILIYLYDEATRIVNEDIKRIVLNILNISSIRDNIVRLISYFKVNRKIPHSIISSIMKSGLNYPASIVFNEFLKKYIGKLSRYVK